MIQTIAVRGDESRVDAFCSFYDHALFGRKSGNVGSEQLDASDCRIGADTRLSPGEPAEPCSIDSAAENVAVRAQSRFLPDHDIQESVFILE